MQGLPRLRPAWQEASTACPSKRSRQPSSQGPVGSFRTMMSHHTHTAPTSHGCSVSEFRTARILGIVVKGRGFELTSFMILASISMALSLLSTHLHSNNIAHQLHEKRRDKADVSLRGTEITPPVFFSLQDREQVFPRCKLLSFESPPVLVGLTNLQNTYYLRNQASVGSAKC